MISLITGTLDKIAAGAKKAVSGDTNVASIADIVIVFSLQVSRTLLKEEEKLLL
ncbi:hypothetical protein [Borrelia turicatae]|uniref:hypothetical protein n=1 Tax=Borrelia turicatae TaxID=142 RepID=UPI0013747E33|nr:hypothetical protein [Borrelia turicatae]UPA14182.1 hypothetical protein bt91E135_001357 [Borrelia turicatae 91E135]